MALFKKQEPQAPKTFDSIVAGLSGIVEELEDYKNQQISLADVKTEEAAKLLAQSQTHRDESSKSGVAAEKIKALYSVNG